MPPALSVVIPAYNERHRLAQTLPGAITWLDEHRPGAEIIVADDGSTDDTLGIVPPRVRTVRLAKNTGKGAAVRAGVRASTGAQVLVSDADFSTPLSELPRLEARLESGSPIAIGSRGLPDADIRRAQPRHRQTMGRIFGWISRQWVLDGIQDSQCGFKLFDGDLARALFAEATIDGFAFDVEILALARRGGHAIAEVPILWQDNPDTRVSILAVPPRMLWELYTIYQRFH